MKHADSQAWLSSLTQQNYIIEIELVIQVLLDFLRYPFVVVELGLGNEGVIQ